MKIGFTGSQGTGKTTLAEKMVESAYFRDYIFVPSAARDAANAGFGINQSATPLDQLVTTTARLVKEDKAFTKENVISDRMLADSFAYTSYQAEIVWDMPDKQYDYYMELSRDLALMSAKRYDRIFFFPPYWFPEDDGGTRSTDRGYQLGISDIIEDFLDKNLIKYETVPPVSIEDRVEWINSEIYTMV